MDESSKTRKDYSLVVGLSMALRVHHGEDVPCQQYCSRLPGKRAMTKRGPKT